MAPRRCRNAPRILSISATPDEDSAVIAWTLSEVATGQVEYGLTSAYGKTSVLESSYDFDSHSQGIPKSGDPALEAATTYHYRVVGRDRDGYRYTGPDRTFTTDGVVPPPEPPDPGLYPSTVVTQTTKPLNAYAMPGVLVPVDDTVFGTKVMRLLGIGNTGNLYATKPAWNANGSLLLIAAVDQSTKYLLRGSDFALLQQGFSIGTHFTWDANDPTKAYSHAGGLTINEYTYDTTTGSRTVVQHVLSSPSPGAYTAIDWGAGEGRTSKGSGANQGKFAFRWQKSGSTGIGVWDAESLTVVYEKVISGVTSMSGIDFSKISWSGRYICWAAVFGVIGTGQHQGMWIWDTQTDTGFQVQRQQDHGDFSADASEADWFVYRGNASPDQVHQGVWAIRCSDALKRPLVPPSTGMGHGPSSLHVSGCNFKRPGFATVSEYSGGYGSPMFGQIFNISIDDPTEVEVFCQTHLTSSPDYTAEPQAVVHPIGHQVIWHTKWQGAALVYPFICAVDLP